MSDELKEFLNRENIKEALQEYNFKYIYDKLLKEMFIDDKRIPEFTELMLSLGYNPLDYMTRVPPYFLRWTRNVKEFTIPKNVKYLDEFAFYACLGLTTLTIPKSIIGIGSYAFGKCKNLKTIYYEGTEEDWKRINIDKITNRKLSRVEIIFNK